MKTTFITLVLIISFSIVKAQKQDTIYSGCKLKNDTTQTIGDPAILDSCPQFGNGFNDLSIYISNHIQYSVIDKYNYKQDKVIVEIIIEKDGSISHPKVVRHLSDNLDNEALRVIKSLPKWKPGRLNGHPVRVRYWVPISFKPPTKSR